MAKKWDKEPAWLTKKRQLATVLTPRLAKTADQQQWLAAWQDAVVNEGEKNTGWLNREAGITALPLTIAVNKYSELLQENLMEKAIRWQDNQLNAAHLAQLDCGQFIYVPSDVKGEVVLSYSPRIAAPNPHNVIIIGAHTRVIIEERVSDLTIVPTYAATEILVGAGAKVIYRQANTFAAERALQAVYAYQAHGSQLKFEIAEESDAELQTSLYSFLDGQQAFWQTTVGLAGNGKHKLRALVDGFGQATRAHLDVAVQNTAQVEIAPFKTASGEPLSLVKHVRQTDNFTKEAEWLAQNCRN